MPMAGGSHSHVGTEKYIQIDSRARASFRILQRVWCARADSGKSVASEVRGARRPAAAVDVSIC